MRKKGTLYFFTGLAGAGKSTIGGLFYRRLKEKNERVILWDGDQRRAAAGNVERKDYSTQARKEGGFNILRSCGEMTERGDDVVCCVIAMYDEVRNWARANVENYKEIYIRVPMEILYQRDQKGLYSSGAKQVVGVDLPWDEPKTPDIVIDNDGSETPEQIVGRLEQFFGIEGGEK